MKRASLYELCELLEHGFSTGVQDELSRAMERHYLDALRDSLANIIPLVREKRGSGANLLEVSMAVSASIECPQCLDFRVPVEHMEVVLAMKRMARHLGKSEKITSQGARDVLAAIEQTPFDKYIEMIRSVINGSQALPAP